MSRRRQQVGCALIAAMGLPLGLMAGVLGVLRSYDLVPGWIVTGAWMGYGLCAAGALVLIVERFIEPRTP